MTDAALDNPRRKLQPGDVLWPTAGSMENGTPREAPTLPPGRHPNPWTTPTVQDSSKATKRWRENRQNNLTALVFFEVHAKRDLHLSPHWIETLMGWPAAWTA